MNCLLFFLLCSEKSYYLHLFFLVTISDTVYAYFMFLQKHIPYELNLFSTGYVRNSGPMPGSCVCRYSCDDDYVASTTHEKR